MHWRHIMWWLRLFQSLTQYFWKSMFHSRHNQSLGEETGILGAAQMTLSDITWLGKHPLIWNSGTALGQSQDSLSTFNGQIFIYYDLWKLLSLCIISALYMCAQHNEFRDRQRLCNWYLLSNLSGYITFLLNIIFILICNK